MDTKPLSCKICEKGFLTIWDLKKHETIHTGEKPHQCTICKKKFRVLFTLKKHISSKHNHKCDLCKKKFVTEDDLDSHFVALHVDTKLSSDLMKRTKLMLSLNKGNK